MNRNFKNLTKLFFGCIILAALIFSGSCQNWMNDDGFKDKIETEVHDANAAPVSVYVRYANSKMGTTEPQGNITMKVDVETELTAVTSDDYGFVKWAAFSTTDFSSSKQHSSLIYESAAHYEQNYKPLELSSSEIFFSNPTDPVTKVKIYKERNDIFIIPIVAKRPTIVTSVPSNGRSDVVRNSSIRILFSKPIEESSLKDSEGNSNIVVTSGSAVLTENSDDMGAKEITDYFDIKLSKTKKMVTLSLKQGIYMDNNSQINVNIYEDVCDTDGFTMNGKYTFTFTTGTKLDSLAPRIDELSAGIGDDCLAFEQYKYIKKGSNETVPNYTDEAEKATNNIDTFVTGDAALVQASKKPILKQRVKDYINIYVQATDIAGAGRNVDDTNTNNLSESDVALIQVRATLYVDKDGVSKTTSKLAFEKDSTVSTDYYKDVTEIGYAMGLKDSSCKIQKKFEDILPDANGGTIFTYDLSDMPDGLIKIDVWAIDMVGNSGETEEYVAEYNNGYRSIFVVKDYSAPSAENAISKININAEDAPYKWYNRNSLSQIQIKEKDNSSITDLNDCAALRSDFNDLKWAFKLGKDLAWKPSPTDTTIWTPIHTNNVSNIRTLANAAASADGAIDITMCLMDDLGNISKPVIVESINYDNTAPVISSSVTSKVNWVKKPADVYTEAVAVTDSNLLSSSGHILKIPFTENGAGIRRVKVTVTKEGTTQTINQGNYTITYVPDSGESRELTYTDLASDNTIKELNSSDTSKVNSGTLYISKIQIGEQTGSYKVRVDIWDSALNTTYTETTITIDKTNPVINKLYIPDLKKSISAGPDGLTTEDYDGWFLPEKWISGPSGYQNSLLTNKPGYIPLYIFLKEQDSGIKQIVFESGDVVISKQETGANTYMSQGKTKVYKIENYGRSNEVRTLIPEDDYKLDVTAKTITFNDDKCLKSQADEFVILVENIGFKSIKDGNNIIDVKVYDLATREAQKNKISPYTNKNTEIDGVKADGYLFIAKNTYKLLDRKSTATTLAAADGYTNENIINLKLTLDNDSKSSASSGYNSFRISGATFTNATQVKIGNESFDYELSDNNTVITLRNKENGAFTDDYIVIRNQTVDISDVSFTNTEGVKNIDITTYDLSGIASAEKELKITYDKTNPAVTKLPFVTDYSGSPDYYKPQYNVYPHEDSSNDTGELINGVPTFYTSTTYRSGATQTNGTLSDITDAQYGVVLGVSAFDTYALYSNSNDTFVRYYKHKANDTDVTKETVIQNGVYASSDLGNSAADGTLKTGFDVGKYSAIVVDSAGNTSDVFHFNVVKDTTKPADIAWKLITLDIPDGAGIYKVPDSMHPGYSYFAFDFRDSTSSYNNPYGIYINKYVIKKTSDANKYKIVVNLNSTGTKVNDLLLSGTKATSSDLATYGESVNATASSSPIEQYAISLWYGGWVSTATDGSTNQYQPAVPMNTVLPNGIQLNANNYLTYSSYLRNYFNYTFYWEDSYNYKNSSWLVASGYNSWHNFVPGGSPVTDTGSSITSYIDNNNNLIIEIPNTYSDNLPPISVFLRDGCGNMNYVVLRSTDSSSSYPISFITDGKLGYQTTDDNGQVTSPIVIQNPFMDPAGTDMTWDGVDYSWNLQSGNAYKDGNDGVGEKRGFIKDFVKNQTYYNDAYTSFKLALTLRFGTSAGNNDYAEAALFSSSGKTTSTTDYTCRAILYTTTNANEVPGYNTITSGKTDSDWTYAQADSSASEINILLDYPKPSYTTPFYIWYLIEDRLGNYEIAKVVNSAASGNALRANTAGMFDKWVYDNQGPILTTRQSGLDPSQVEDINELVGSNNGFVPYAVDNGSTKTVYVHASKTHFAVQSGEALNNTAGTGTTHVIDGHPTNNDTGDPVYNSFADLAVSESTGIRAFAWSTSPTAPSIDSNQSNWDSSTWYTSSTSIWYVGWLQVSNMCKDIGVDHNYGGKEDSPYFAGDYSGKYSGTKLCTIFPYGKLDTSTPTPLYIHLIDWTGNISSYRIGKNIEFINDSIAPEYTSSSVAGTSVADQYFIKKDSSANPVVRIAGNGTIAQNHQPIDIYISSAYYYVESGSGIKGYSLSAGSSEIADYLRIPYDTYYKNNEEPQNITYYVYDNVGNRKEQTLQLIFDANPPKIRTVSLVTQAGSGTEFVDSSGLVTDTVDGFGKVFNYPYASAPYYSNATQIDNNKLQVVYLNKTGYTKFHVNLDDNQASYYEDVDDVQINKWVVTNATTGAGNWQTIARYNKTNSSLSSGDWSGDCSTGFYMGTSASYGYTIDFDKNGTYYQILVSDISGNTSCQYFKLYLDNTAPVFDGNPVLTVTKGSVNKIGSTTSYAYTADSNHKAKLSIKIKDEGAGTFVHKYKYRIDSGDWSDWIESASQVYSFDYDAFSGGNIETIYLQDIFGNVTNGTVTYTYSTADDISKLVYYDPDTKPSNPSFANISVTTKGSNNFSNSNYEKISDGNIIRILKKDRTEIKIKFPAVTGNLMGYVDSVPAGTLEEFSLANNTVTTEFTYPLNKTDFEKTYYAVDYAGNYSGGLTVVFTYNNPHLARDAQFLETIPDVTDSTSGKTLSELLAADGIALTPTILNGSTRYYTNGYILIKCTLYSKASNYTYLPSKLTLYDGNTNTQKGEFTTNMKRYILGDETVTTVNGKQETRYNCYLAIPLSNTQNNAKLWCTITGGDISSAEGNNVVSEKMNLTGANTITWVIDVTAPEIRNNISGGTQYWDTDDDNVKKLYNYEIRKAKAAADGTLAAVIETIPLAKDGHIGPGGITNLYDSGNVVYFKIRKDSNNVYFYDSASGIKSYKFVITGPETVSDTKYNATASKNDSDWKPVRNVSINTGGYYEFELPDVSTPNCHLALFLMDNFGNVSEPYYLGNKGDKGYQWWLLDTAPASINVTKTGTNEAPAWINGTLSYVVDVLKGNTDVGAVIRSITAENATIAAVNFYDYDGNRWGNASQPAYDSSTGKFNDNEAWINVSGIKITLNVEQGYTAKTVKLKVNNAEKELFEISAKPLVADVITVTNGGNALPAQINQNLNNYVLTIGVPAGVTITSVTVQPDDVQLNWDSNSPLNATITASQGDTDKIIKLVVNNVAKDLFTLKAAEQQTGGGGAGGGNVNGNIRGSGLALLQGLVAGSSSGGFGSNKNFVMPVEVQEIVSISTKAAVSEKSAAPKKAAAKQTSKKKSKAKAKSAAQVQAQAVVEKAAAQVQEVLSDAAPIEAATSAPEAVTSVSSVTSEASVVEPQAALSGTTEDIISVAQPEKSTSKTALIVVMLALLSAAAGAWYLRKSRK